MLRDANHRQAIQKFSFIESLNLSRLGQAHSRSSLGRINMDRAFCFQQRQKSLPKKSSSQAAIVPTQETTATIDRHWYEANTDYSLSLAEIINASADRNYLPLATNSHSSTATRRIGKLVFALACGYGLFVCYWLFGHQGDKILTLLGGGKQITLSKSEVEFIDYMERSLEQIERERVALTDNSDEVVFVPVYTPEPIGSQNLSSTAAQTITPTISTPPAPPPAPLAIPAPPPLASPTPIAKNPASAIASKPQISHTLTGVLELSADRSAALVKVNGKTRRIWVGEKIHTDGWILQSVGNQEATIEHQGQLRSISVGETF